jgi:hypothetical protein
VAAAAADLDNDGDQELLLTSDRGFFTPLPSELTLYRNDGDGTFTDITAASGLIGPASQFSVAFGDIDNDGLLDVFVTGTGALALGVEFPSKLFRNDGNLTFTDISASAGIDTTYGACVVLFSDYDLDGLADIFVGNCGDVLALPTPMELFRNNGDGTFTDVAQQVGLLGLGLWMGLAPGDFDNDGDVDLFVSNAGDARPLGILPHGLFRNNGDGTYTDLAPQYGLGQLPWAWGNAFEDFDNDGDLDLFFTGAFPNPFDPSIYIGPDGTGNPGVLWAGDGQGGFVPAALPVDMRHHLTSGGAAGDYDGDGFQDLVVVRSLVPGLSDSGHPVLLHNTGNGNRWLQVRTVGSVSNRDGIGARVTVEAGGRSQVREVYAGSSLASMHSQTLAFGLGAEKKATVEVRWPSGFRNRLYDVQDGNVLVFPEIPCSFDTPASLRAYRACVTSALADLDQRGLLPAHQKGRFQSSALRAYHEAH